ncbi:MAG TPA: response regulator [Nitrospiria bacterium]|jgi:CheY-like chemotaxis protein|nr:response regulator [Nitrospiria bacterium]
MNGKVLLVDDTEFYLKLYKTKLLTEGYVVTTANNGLEAIKAITAEKPDIILLDLVMPVMDGFKFLVTIKADPQLKDIPVVVFSGKGNSDEVGQAITAGAADFLVKATTTPNKVVEKIQKIMAKSAEPAGG